MPSDSDWPIQKEDIDLDPSNYSEEELREIMWNGIKCAKLIERVATNGQKNSESFWAYDVIKHFDEVPHDRTPSDIVMENSKKMSGEK